MQAIMPNRSLQWEENCFHFLMHLMLTFTPVGKARPLGGPIVSLFCGQWIDPEAVCTTLQPASCTWGRVGRKWGKVVVYQWWTTPTVCFPYKTPWKAAFNHAEIFLPALKFAPGKRVRQRQNRNKPSTYTVCQELCWRFINMISLHHHKVAVIHPVFRWG